MSLLVLDPDIAAGELLKQQLTDLGFDTLTTADTRAAVGLSEKGNVDLVVCCEPGLAVDLERLRAGVGVVVASPAPLSTADVVNAMRHGALDCWESPLEAGELKQRVRQACKRVKRLVKEINAEVSNMRAELERDQRAGQYIQMGMLPPNPMGIGHYRLQHRVEPSLILSGDFVDYFQISDRHFACYVADVAGHGASSAFVTVLLKNFSRRLRREYRVSMLSNPGEVLSWINSELIDQGLDKHVAMFFAIVDMGKDQLHYANAAHLPPAMLVVDGQLVSLEQKGKPLGLFEDAEFESRSTAFPPGAKVVIFSDGVLDLIPAATLEEKERLLADAIRDSEDMESLWNGFDPTRLGLDDVSCLFIRHGV